MKAYQIRKTAHIHMAINHWENYGLPVISPQLKVIRSQNWARGKMEIHRGRICSPHYENIWQKDIDRCYIILILLNPSPTHPKLSFAFSITPVPWVAFTLAAVHPEHHFSQLLHIVCRLGRFEGLRLIIYIHPPSIHANQSICCDLIN